MPFWGNKLQLRQCHSAIHPDHARRRSSPGAERAREVVVMALHQYHLEERTPMPMTFDEALPRLITFSLPRLEKDARMVLSCLIVCPCGKLGK